MRALWIAAFLAALAPRAAPACACHRNGVCQSLEESAVIFLAETLSVEEGGVNPTLRVLERFRGLPEEAGDEVEIEAFFGRYCRNPPYRPGQRTLVFLSASEDGVLRDGLCTKSVLVESGSPELALIRGYFQGELRTLLRGVVSAPGDNAGWDAPVDGATVEAELGGVVHSTSADSQGRYELVNLPPGTYRLRPRALGYRNIRGARDVRIPEAGCTTRNIALAPSNSLSGVVRGDGSQPLSGVRVALYHDSVQPDRAAQETETGADGAFSFQSVAPGSYRVVVNPQGPTPDAPWDPVYLGGARDRANAQLVYLGPASSLSGQDVRLGRPYASRTIEVLLASPDGSRAAGHVVCRDASTGFATNAAADGGVARCAALAGRAYDVRVTSVPDLGVQILPHWDAAIPAGAGDAQVRIVVGP